MVGRRVVGVCLALVVGVLASCSPDQESGLPFPPERVMVQIGADSPPELEVPVSWCSHYDVLEVLSDRELPRISDFRTDGPGRTLDVRSGVRELVQSSPEFAEELFVVEDWDAYVEEITEGELDAQLDQMLSIFVSENLVAIQPGGFTDLDGVFAETQLVMPISVWHRLVDLDDDVVVHVIVDRVPDPIAAHLLDGAAFAEVDLAAAVVGDEVSFIGRCASGQGSPLQATAELHGVSEVDALLGVADGSLMTPDTIAAAFAATDPLERSFGDPGMPGQWNNRLVDFTVQVSGQIPAGEQTVLCVRSNLARSGCTDLADGPTVLPMDRRGVTEVYLVEDFLRDGSLDHGDVYEAREVLVSGEFNEKRPWTLTVSWDATGDPVATVE